MPTNVHSRLPGEEIHRPFRQVFTDLSDLASDATTYTSDDLNKMALVESTNAIYILTQISPIVWSPVSGGTASGGFKFAKFEGNLVGTDTIAGTVTTYTPFATQFSIPVGTIAENDMMDLSFVIQIDGGPSLSPSPEVTSNFDVAIKVGGIASLTTVYSGSSTSGSSDPLYWGQGGTSGGFQVLSGNNALTLVGVSDFSSSFDTKSCIIFPFTSFSSINSLEVIFRWDGANSAAVASLTLLQAKITPAV